MTPTFKSSDRSQNEMGEETSFANCNNAIYLDETSFTKEILLKNIRAAGNESIQSKNKSKL